LNLGVCDFISIATRKALAREETVTAPRGFQLSSYANPNLLRHLPQDFELRALITGGCSCDLCRRAKCEKGAPPSVILRADAVGIILNLTAKHFPLFLYVHFYSGDISTEHLPPLRLAKLKASRLQQREPIPYDTLIELTTK
jgi:hypothetical protein